MADTLEIEIINSYMAITAATTAEFMGMSLDDIVSTLRSRVSTLVKLELDASKGAIKNNQRLEELEAQRQDLQKFVDGLLLALTEIKSAPTKNLTEEQFRQREESIADLDKKLSALKQQLRDFDKTLTYLYDVNEDIHSRARQRMNGCLKEVAALNEQKVEIVMGQLQKLNIEIKDPEQFKKKLHKIFNGPELQAMLIEAAKQQPKKSLGEKLKGLFR